MAEKTEEPTPRRLRKAREEGDSGASAYASQTVAFVVAVSLVPPALAALATRAAVDLRLALARVAASSSLRPLHVAVRVDAADLGLTLVLLAVPPLLAAAVAGATAQAVQTGGMVSSTKLAPRLDRLDPVAGLRGLFSAPRLFAAVRALIAGAVVGSLAFAGLRDHLLDLARLAGRTRWSAVVIRDVAAALAWRAASVGLVLGAIDVVVTRRAWSRKLRMSKDEVRREHRETEGDPQLKAARDRANHELLAQATLANVRDASVVVVNPTHFACALRYDEARGDEAPIVVANGDGDFAARIVRAARERGVPVVHDLPLARVLVELEVGRSIPESLYEAVAEILREVRDRADLGAAVIR